MICEGFRFEYAHSDPDAPGGVRKEYYIALAASWDDAFSKVMQLVADPRRLRVYSHGPAVRNDAHKLGIVDGEASIIKFDAAADLTARSSSS